VTKVLTVGTFDMPHSGHLELFKKCRQIASLGNDVTSQVVVGVNSDQFVNMYKFRFPVYPYSERSRIIASLRDVDRVIENDETSLQKMLAIEKPTFLIVGSDWAAKDYYKQIGVGRDWLAAYHITLLYVEYTQKISSTYLRKRLSENESV
jgi:glycerol-3-phosphate cytidylyltransferase